MRVAVGAMTRRRVASVLVASALVAGCGTTGDDQPEESADDARSTPGAAEAEQPLSPEREQGRELFTDNCGSCHTLDAAGTQGSIGPDLDEVQANSDEVLTAIREGPGAMPENVVSGSGAEAIAVFVAESGPGS